MWVDVQGQLAADAVFFCAMLFGVTFRDAYIRLYHAAFASSGASLVGVGAVYLFADNDNAASVDDVVLAVFGGFAMALGLLLWLVWGSAYYITKKNEKE